ncbi:MAG TPA: glutamate--tRNA ligase family protein [Verrucomicrobiae bacterium]|nr:glutamate--tRNA ligase family protein [Verrucomicrobiae bacterium]
MSVRVRFAPSPTGFLHIGGARTALFNWLYAKHTGGTFVLRIEDTDTARNTQEAVEIILSGMRWLGLDWDEGPTSGDGKASSKGSYGPYFQSQRSDLYKKRVRELIDKGAAYEHEGAIKFRMQREPIVIPDLVVGDVRRELTDREQLDPDFVIFRSDGQPVFHFVNVVDDLEMKITHVIRGEDHLTNTAKHLALFKAFGVEPPKYAHIPLILNPDGTKMSKRDRGASLREYIEALCLPEAVVNYLFLLGWSPKGDREIVPLDEVIKLFDLPQILRHNARFDVDKLHWINSEYVRLMSQERFNDYSVRALERAGISIRSFDPSYVNAAFSTGKEKVKQFLDVDVLRTKNEKKHIATTKVFSDFYFLPQVEVDAELSKELNGTNKRIMQAEREALARLTTFNADAVDAATKKVAADLGVKIGLVVHPTRVACTGRTVGPSLYHLMEVLGRQRVLERIDRFIAQCV